MRARRSIGFPLTLGIILLILVLTLAVGWTTTAPLYTNVPSVTGF